MNLSYGTLERRLQELDTAVAELSLEVWFSSDDRALERLVNYIESATATFDISMYALTHPVIGAAILRRYHSGVRVRIATDFDMARDYPELILEFIASGIPVYVRRTRVMMHEKFAVLDGRLILCGSANWSLAAFQGRAGNYENIYAFRNVFAARIHTVHFEKLVSEGNYLVEDSLL
ncbi:hypothetical protein PHYBOEH_009863 [Phytophthora boehmeriae]|uniref:Mitochondrial cardiolipin hydrolase n=1 Tax=Phytophthora boehmeriae TaxID=109152 RepID=A0A8T1VU48_9STRA|nr:hypothetical protein PHYBOEH_009863 [Phytophthora boehmeriae]